VGPLGKTRANQGYQWSAKALHAETAAMNDRGRTATIHERDSPGMTAIGLAA
jgi:hypothetical protein